MLHNIKTYTSNAVILLFLICQQNIIFPFEKNNFIRVKANCNVSNNKPYNNKLCNNDFDEIAFCTFVQFLFFRVAKRHLTTEVDPTFKYLTYLGFSSVKELEGVN